jgi:hypothetical protein
MTLGAPPTASAVRCARTNSKEQLPREFLTGVRMAKLSDEHRRALRTLGSPNGHTEADMLTHGFELATLGDVMFEGFALAAPQGTSPVMWIVITEAGRKAIAE